MKKGQSLVIAKTRSCKFISRKYIIWWHQHTHEGQNCDQSSSFSWDSLLVWEQMMIRSFFLRDLCHICVRFSSPYIPVGDRCELQAAQSNTCTLTSSSDLTSMVAYFSIQICANICLCINGTVPSHIWIHSCCGHWCYSDAGFCSFLWWKYRSSF